MTDIDTKNSLLAGDPATANKTEEVKTHAGVVIVRPLTRGEVLDLNDQRRGEELTFAQFEARMVSLGMVSPTMTPAEVSQWQSVDNPGGSLADVTDAISRISGLDEGASKSGVPGAAGAA